MPIPYRKEWVKPDGRRLSAGGPRDLQRRQKMAEAQAATDAELISFLKEQIVELKEELKSVYHDKSPEGYFTAEEVDEEIRKAVEEAVKETMVSMKRNSQNLNQNLEPRLQSYKEQILKLQKQNDDFKTAQKDLVEQNSKLQNQVKRLEGELGVVDDTIREYKEKVLILEQSIKAKEEVIETLKSRPIIVKGSVEDEDFVDVPKRPQMENKFIDPLGKDDGKGLKSNIKVKTESREGKVDDKVNKLKNLIGGLPKR